MPKRPASAFSGTQMVTYVYVDGFNLYYGAVRGTSYKWLDINHLCGLLLPRHSIAKIKYFTARVGARPSDPGQPVRQETFLRALRTLPNVEIIFGHFLSNDVMMPVASGQPALPRYVKVTKTEEKGSDVNLATHLLWDGFRGLYQAAVLITNDSDLLEPVRIVRQELGKTVGILNPHKHPSRALLKHASFLKPIRAGVLASAQFPPHLTDAVGRFQKPPTW